MEFQKVFLHVDLDAFFASVEQLDNPSLKGKPVIVGGCDERRSVVSTASYEARKFGVHSAMPVVVAKRLCPNGIFLPVRMKRYKEKSDEIMAIFSEYSPDVQQMSIDEAFIDLTGTERLFGAFSDTAKRLKKDVFNRTGLTVSVGLASTKYVAKIASGMNKPDGLFIVPFGDEEKFMRSLPIEKVWGIGEKTRLRLKSKCMDSVERIFNSSLENLQSLFGNSTGSFLFNAVRGKEYERFNVESKNHSISNETTFSYDLYSMEEISKAIFELSDSVMNRLWNEKMISKSVSVKIRYGDFSTVSVSRTFESEISSKMDLYEKALLLFKSRFVFSKGLRLLGIALQNVIPESQRELSLFDDEVTVETKESKVEKAMSKLESKLGVKITTASFMK